jgi:signal transduction histidine kinase
VVPVPATVLEVLVGNLIENGIKYTPPGGRVRVAVLRQREHLLLRVTDSGPGIPEGDRQRVFDRFYRPAGQPEPGAGLGLAIVRRICDRYGIEIALGEGEDGAGLRVDLIFPAAAGVKPHAPLGLRIS